jgi:SNF2 family DNA or RNA helicase
MRGWLLALWLAASPAWPQPAPVVGIILSGTPFQNNFEELRSIIHLLLPANDEAMDFFNTLTDNVTYRRIYI